MTRRKENLTAEERAALLQEVKAIGRVSHQQTLELAAKYGLSHHTVSQIRYKGESQTSMQDDMFGWTEGSMTGYYTAPPWRMPNTVPGVTKAMLMSGRARPARRVIKENADVSPPGVCVSSTG